MPESLVRDNLVAGDFPVATDSVTIAAGQNLKRGTVLGKISKGASSAVAAPDGAGTEGANTGNGTLVLDATTPLLAGNKPGIYKIKIVAAAVADPATAAKANVYDPDGDLIDIISVAATTGTEFEKQIAFVITDGSTPFVAGDGFKVTVAVAAGSGYFKTVNSANVDGSEVPNAVLLEDVDASSAAANGVVGLTGEYNTNSLVFGGSDTAALHKEALRALSIFIKPALGA